jgi:hypothetical protein
MSSAYEKIAINSIIKATEEKKISWDIVSDEHCGNATFFAKIPKYSITVKTIHKEYKMILEIFDRLGDVCTMNSELPPSLYKVTSIEIQDSWKNDFPHPLLRAIYRSFYKENQVKADDGSVKWLTHEPKEPFKDRFTDINQFIREIKSLDK